jgi:hypothetical protein
MKDKLNTFTAAALAAVVTIGNIATIYCIADYILNIIRLF